MRQVCRPDPLDQCRNAGIRPRPVLVDLQNMLIAIRKLFYRILHGKIRRQRTGVFTHISPGQRLMQMYPPDHPGKAAMPVEHFRNVPQPIPLGDQIRIGIHQMPGIQHDPLARITDTVQQAGGFFRIGERKTRPPLVFH